MGIHIDGIKREMNKYVTLKLSNGNSISAYESRPKSATRGGLILLQEIFGVNHHIRSVADSYAAEGYRVVAPALFDHIERGVELGYQGEDMVRAKDLRSKVSFDQALEDVAAARDLLSDVGAVAVLGYCWGGAIAWLAACRLSGIRAAVSYYGGGIGSFAHETPRCPVQCHFGETDTVIPMADVEKVRLTHPQGVEVHVYPAGHGFSCDERGSYHAESATIARRRSLDFLCKHIGAISGT